MEHRRLNFDLSKRLPGRRRRAEDFVGDAPSSSGAGTIEPDSLLVLRSTCWENHVVSLKARH